VYVTLVLLDKFRFCWTLLDNVTERVTDFTPASSSGRLTGTPTREQLTGNTSLITRISDCDNPVKSMILQGPVFDEFWRF
jgi:hypothetical protein